MGPRLRSSRLWVWAALLTQTASACAEGGTNDPPGRGRDAGPIVRSDGGDAGRTDGGGPVLPDAGPMCVDDHAGASCAMAHPLGTVAVGAMAMSDVAVIPMAGGEDWYSVTFTPLSSPMMFGGGTPRIRFSMNEGDAFRLDVSTACGAAATCGMGAPTATALTEYSFTDDQSMPGDNQWSSRMNAWPTTLHIRVRRTTPGASCAHYVVAVSR